MTHDDSRSQVTNIYQAMQWPGTHTDRLLESLRSAGDMDDRQHECDISDSDTESETEQELKVPGLNLVFAMFDAVPMSTAFSGIDAPGTGISQQVAELNSRVRDRNLERHLRGSNRREPMLGEPIHLNAIEKYGPSQTELLCHPSKPKCLFSDITEFLPASLRSMIPDLHAKGKVLDVLGPSLRHKNALNLSEA